MAYANLSEIIKDRRKKWDEQNIQPPHRADDPQTSPVTSDIFWKNIIFYVQKVKRQTISSEKDVRDLARVDHNLALWLPEFDKRRAEDETLYQLAREENTKNYSINVEKLDNELKKGLDIPAKKKKPKYQKISTDYDDVSAEVLKAEAWEEIEAFANSSLEDRRRAMFLARRLKKVLEDDQ